MKNRIGEVFINSYGVKYTIIEYINCNDITIQYENGYIKNHVSYSNIIKNKIKSPYDKTVCNVGYIGEGCAPLTTKDDRITTPYGYWLNMIKRCYSDKLIKYRPTYNNKVVCEEWHNYNNFYKWYCKNYYIVDNETMCLDKDILIKGNKIYSPDTCIFVPQRINSLFVSCKSKRGKYPIGVSYNKYKYISQYSKSIDNIQNNIIIGSYDTPKEAFDAYKTEKEKYIKFIADKYKNKIPQKLYDAMYRYEIEITD